MPCSSYCPLSAVQALASALAFLNRFSSFPICCEPIGPGDAAPSFTGHHLSCWCPFWEIISGTSDNRWLRCLDTDWLYWNTTYSITYLFEWPFFLDRPHVSLLPFNFKIIHLSSLLLFLQHPSELFLLDLILKHFSIFFLLLLEAPILGVASLRFVEVIQAIPLIS